jgi:2,5-diketo-D-gluconate reductase A
LPPAEHLPRDLDLFIINQPFGDYYGSWRDGGVHREGLARAIGVSNFYPDRLVDLIEHNEAAPMVDQVECHPFFQRTAEQQLMSDRGVQIESWGPFAEGRNNLFTDSTLTEIGSTHGKSVAQLVLRWLIQRGVVVVQKSGRAQRMRENMDIFDVSTHRCRHVPHRRDGLRRVSLLRSSRPCDGEPIANRRLN